MDSRVRGHPLAERLPLALLLIGDVVLARRQLAERVDGADVGVIERRRRARLLLEALLIVAHFGVRGPAGTLKSTLRPPPTDSQSNIAQYEHDCKGVQATGCEWLSGRLVLYACTD